jgi:hypothetical protein
MTKQELKALIKECLFESMNESDEYTQWRNGFKDELVSHLEGYEEYYA